MSDGNVEPATTDAPRTGVIRRFLPSRKFTARCLTALTALWVVVWIASLFGFVSVTYDLAGRQSSVNASLHRGSLFVDYYRGFYLGSDKIRAGFRTVPALNEVGGVFYYFHSRLRAVSNGRGVDVGSGTSLAIPLPCLIFVTALAAYVARSGFRFSLKFLLIVVTVTSILIAWYVHWQPSLARAAVLF